MLSPSSSLTASSPDGRRSLFRGSRQAWLWMAVALIVRLAYLAEQGADSPLFRQPLLDEQEAVESARELLAGRGFGQGPLFKAPGYTLLLATAMTVFGEAWPWGMRLVQHALGALLAGLAFDTARRLVPAGRARRVAGTLAGGAAALHGPLVRLESCVCLDFLVAFLQSAMVWALVRWATAERPPCRNRASSSRRWLLAAGTLATAAWLTRPTLMPVLPLLAGWVALHAWRNCVRAAQAGGLRHAAAGAALFLALPLTAMGAVYLRNALAGETMLLPWQGGYNLYHANRAGASGRYLTQDEFARSSSGNPTRTLAVDGWRRALAEGRIAPPRDGGQFGAVNAYWFGLARREILADPLRWLALMGRKMVYLVSDKEIFNFEEYDLHRSLSRILPWLPGRFGLAWPFALASLALLGRVPPARRPAWGLLGLYFIGLALSIALYYTSGRMRVPLAFPVIVTGAAGIGLLCRPPFPPLRTLLLYAALAAAGTALSWGDWWGVRSERMWHADLSRLSNAAWREGRAEQALTFAEQVEAERPGYPTVPLLRGQALYVLGRREEAARAFRESMQRLAGDPVAPYNLGIILYDEQNDPAGAWEAYAEALRRDPTYVQAAWRGALARLKLGDRDGARRLLEPYAPMLHGGSSGGPPPRLLVIAQIALTCTSGQPAEAARLVRLLPDIARPELEEELMRLGLTGCLADPLRL